MSSHKAVLQVKEQQVLHLEEKELQLQQEVWSLILLTCSKVLLFVVSSQLLH